MPAKVAKVHLYFGRDYRVVVVGPRKREREDLLTIGKLALVVSIQNLRPLTAVFIMKKITCTRLPSPLCFAISIVAFVGIYFSAGGGGVIPQEIWLGFDSLQIAVLEV